MKAIKLSTNVFVLMVLLASLTALPATAQSRWDGQYPAVFGLAKGGMLVSAAPPDLTACTIGYQIDWAIEWPDVDVFSIFFTDDVGAPTWRSHWVDTPSGRGNWSFESDALIRVFILGEGDLDAYKNDPCAFYSTHPYIAEGMGHFTMHSPDDLLTGPGTNPWGWAIKGDLDNYGACPAGQYPRLRWILNWITHSPDYPPVAETKVQIGPTLTCK